jgi:hypothetical protein
MAHELGGHLRREPLANIFKVGVFHPPSLTDPSAPRKTGYGEELPFDAGLVQTSQSHNHCTWH